MIDMKNLRHLPKRDNHNCFGCSSLNQTGLKMTFQTDDENVISRLKVPDHLCGWDNLVHGGIIATILDESMSWTAVHLLKKIILTKSMSIDFKKPIFINKTVTATGRVLEVTSKREAVIEGALYNDRGELCARSQGTYVLFTPAVAKRMNIMNAEALKTFMEIIDAAV